MKKEKALNPVSNAQIAGIDMLGTVIRFKENNEFIYYQDFRWKEGIPHDIDFVIEKKANKTEYWLIADGYGNLKKPNCYGNGSIAVSEKDIISAMSAQ